MHYIELDANNLRRWLLGQTGISGPQTLNVNGFTVYFSDRRGNRDLLGNETAEYGFEDVVNTSSGVGLPDADHRRRSEKTQSQDPISKINGDHLLAFNAFV